MKQKIIYIIFLNALLIYNAQSQVNTKSSTVDIPMVFVEGGTFTMGCTSRQDDCIKTEEPTHKVTLSNYSIGKYEVTQAQWEAVMGRIPNNCSVCNNCPIELVSWQDVQKFISKLNTQTGKTYRLPTEAEWEFAARGGTKSKGYIYSGSTNVDDVAWYGNDNQLYKVGKKNANELGIYDMSGNVWEWCNDSYKAYNSSNQTNPEGSSSGLYKILRGGCYGSNPRYCRTYARNYLGSGSRNLSYGFRLAL